MKPRKRRLPQFRQTGSTILAVLGVLALTSMAVGSALFQARSRFNTSYHSTRWVQAEHAAEAGVELALLTAHQRSWSTDGWASVSGLTALSKTFTISAGVPSALPVRANVAVDTIPMAGAQWLRIRSTGEADVSRGTAFGSVDERDGTLRKLSLRQDRRTGENVAANPRATRTLEVLAAPKPLLPFQFVFASKQKIFFLPNTTTDSYDSSDSAKSSFTTFGSYGTYSAFKRQTHGDVATFDPTDSYFYNAHVWGDVLTPLGKVVQATNVHGTVSKDFAAELPTEVSPEWTIVTQNHGVVANTSKTIVGGTQDNPPRHKFTSIELSSANKAIIIQNPIGQSESWVQLWVTGDVQIDGQNSNGIKLDPGVHATVYLGGNATINLLNSGYGFENGSKRPENLIIRAYGGSSTDTKTFAFGSGDFWGLVSAPWYRVQLDTAGKHVHGSFLATRLDVADGTSLHFDESTRKLQLGTGSAWVVRSWLEVLR
jgi:hypothetical protein